MCMRLLGLSLAITTAVASYFGGHYFMCTVMMGLIALDFLEDY